MKCRLSKLQEKTFKERFKEYPELKKLEKKLIKAGGGFMVPQPEPDLPLLLKEGELFPKLPITFKKMRACNCHSNVSRLYKEGKIDAIVTGWALSDDCLWRQHSWGIVSGPKGDRIVETTGKRKKYYGVILEGNEIDDFVTTNVIR